MQQFDLVVIGSGPAGYIAAIRAAQLGMKVACVEKKQTLGGTCLNVGCIPSKALLNMSEKYYEAQHHFAGSGIIAAVKLDITQMMNKKSQIVAELCKGIEGLFLKNKVSKFIGTGSIVSPNIVGINNNTAKEQIAAKNILIATGSESANLPNIEIDEKYVVSSTGALSLAKVPENMIVIGGGYIGIELGSVWNRLGSKVTVVEYSSTIVPALDEEIVRHFTKILQQQGMEFKFNAKALGAEKKDDKVCLSLKDMITNEQTSITADVALVAIGRKPYVKGLGLDKVGVELDEQGRVKINDKFQTTVPNIYAVGDAVAGAMLAHKAEEEAIAAVEIMAGQSGHVNYFLIPSVVYTHPEVASVGYTEQQLKQNNVNYKVGKFPFLANSRAKVTGATDGMVKILADSKTDRVLGAHIIGLDAGTLIASIVAFMEFGAASEDIARTCHAHPTLSEAIKEAALAVDKRALNF